MIKRKIIISIFTLFLSFKFFGLDEPKNLKLLKDSYPNVNIKTQYNETFQDWELQITIPVGKKESTSILYWADGKLLPENELANQEKYIPIFYDYAAGQPLQAPETYTEEQIEKFRIAGLSSTRKFDPYSPDFFFDAIYNSNTRNSVEQQIRVVTFLGYKVTVNKGIIEPLQRVEKRILQEAETNEAIREFLKTLDHAEGYNWREIRDVYRKSMHSVAIAIDLLPLKMNRHMYWRWTKDQKGDKWMLVPLKSRWIPPYDFINIFEEEGFIWGGKWDIWDNMHFEYRPEIIAYSKQQ